MTRILPNDDAALFGFLLDSRPVLFEASLSGTNRVFWGASSLISRVFVQPKSVIANVVPPRRVQPFMFEPRLAVSGSVVWDPSCAHVVLMTPARPRRQSRVVWLDSPPLAVGGMVGDVLVITATCAYFIERDFAVPIPGDDDWSVAGLVGPLHGEILSDSCCCVLVSQRESSKRLALLTLGGACGPGVLIHLDAENGGEGSRGGASLFVSYFPLQDVLLLDGACFFSILASIWSGVHDIGLIRSCTLARRALLHSGRKIVRHSPCLMTMQQSQSWTVVFFGDKGGSGFHWFRLQTPVSVIQPCAVQDEWTELMLVLADVHGRVCRVVFPQMLLPERVLELPDNVVAEQPPANRFALLEAAARRLARSLSALADAADADDLQLPNTPELEELWSPIASAKRVWPIDASWFVLEESNTGQLILVDHVKQRFVKLPAVGRRSADVLRFFLTSGSHPSLAIAATTGMVCIVVVSSILQSFETGTSVLDVRFLNIGGGRKTCLELVDCSWLAVVRQNTILWFDLEETRKIAPRVQYLGRYC